MAPGRRKLYFCLVLIEDRRGGFKWLRLGKVTDERALGQGGLCSHVGFCKMMQIKMDRGEEEGGVGKSLTVKSLLGLNVRFVVTANFV